MMGFRNFSDAVLIWLVIFIVSPVSSSDKFDEIMQDTIDSFVQGLTDKYSSDFDSNNSFWHPYVYGIGNENREVIHVEEVKKEFIDGDYFEWKYARLGLKHFIVGLSSHSIDLFGSDYKKITSIESSDDLEALAVFTRWNDDKFQPEFVILAITSEPRMNVYILKNSTFENVGSFPLHYAVKGIELCQVGSSTKVVITPKEKDVHIDIYNVEVSNSSQIWFFQRLPEMGSPNVVVFESDPLESVIAVAQDSKIDIYTFDSKLGIFLVYQTVNILHPCRRLFSFTLAYQHYIGCIPQDQNASVVFILYNYNTNEYGLETDTFGNITAVEIYPISVADYRDEYFLIVQDNLGLTHIMSYHGRQIGFQVEYTCEDRDGCPQTVNLSRGIGFGYNDLTVFIFPSGQGSQNSEVFLIKKQIRGSLSPLVIESQNLYSTFQELSKRFEDWEKGVIGVQKRLDKSLQLDKPNIITGTWNVDSISASHVEFKEEAYEEKYSSNQTEDVFNTFKFLDDLWHSGDFSIDLAQTSEELNKFHNNVRILELQINDAVLENSNDSQNVKAAQYVTGTFNSDFMYIQSINTNTIQDFRNATEFLSSLATKTSRLSISGSVIFEQTLRVSKLNTSTINDVAVLDIARLSEENTFNCSLQFDNQFDVFGNVETSAVNGVIIGTELVIPSKATVSGFNFIDGFVVKNNTKTSGIYDFEKVLRRSSDQVVSSHVVFSDLKSVTPITIDLINGYSFSEFISSLITNNYTGEIFGTKTVSETLDVESLHIANSWNLFAFPNFFAHKTQKKVVLSNRKNFTHITAGKVTVGKLLNGLDPVTFVELSSSLDLKHKWTFLENVEIINDISVSKTVDDVNLNELKNSGTLDEYKESYIANADVKFEQEIQVDNLLVESTINGNEFEDSFATLLQFNGSDCEVPHSTTIESTLILDSIIVYPGTVNSQNLELFFTLNQEQNITGTIRLINECQFNSLFALERYDGVNLQKLLLQAVRLTGINKIPWRTRFDHIECGNGMVVEGDINEISNYGISIAVVSGREFQRFGSDLSFTKTAFQNLVVEDDVYLSKGIKLGDLDITSWNSKRLSLSKKEQSLFRFEVRGLVKASHDVITSIINDIPLSILSDSTFRTDRRSQSFLEVVNTQSSMKIINGTITFDGDVSGFFLDDLIKYAFPLNSTHEGWLQLAGIWHFQSIQVSETLTVKGRTCGVDLEDLSSDSVREGESNVDVWGRNSFTSFKVKKNIRVNFLNHKMNFDNLFTLLKAQSIDCPFHFLKDVTVDGSLITNGKLNNVSIESLAASYSQESGNVHIIRGNYLSEHKMTMQLLKVAGLIQWKNFQEQVANLVKTGDRNLEISGHKVFKHPITIRADAVINLYNGIDPSNLKLLKLNDDITFDYPVTFKGSVQADFIQTFVENINPKLIDGIDWDDIILHSIRTNLDASGEHLKNLKFDNIQVQSHIYTRIFQTKLFSDYITLNGDQTIDSLKLHKAEFLGSDVHVTGHVSGVNLLHEFMNTLMTNSSSNTEIEGNKLFKGHVIVNGDFNCFGPKLKDDVIDISKDFNITSPVEFVKPVHVDGGVNVTEPVHGHTIDSIMHEALTQENDQPITAEWEFSGGVVFMEDVSGFGGLENYDLQGLIDKKNIEIKEAEGRILKQKLLFRDACLNVYNLTEELTSNPMKLDSFDKHQSIILRKQVAKIITLSGAGKIYLLASSGNCEITKYEWKFSTELFYKDIDVGQSQLHLGHVEEWESVTHGSTGILVFSTKMSPCSLLEEGIHLLVLEPKEGFSPVSTLLVGKFKGFKIASNLDDTKTAIFVLKEENILQVLYWDQDKLRFSIEIEIYLTNSYDRIEITGFWDGVGVLLTSEKQASIFRYSWITKALVLVGSSDIWTDRESTLALFESYDDLYAIVPQNMTQLSTLHTSCTVQIFKASDREIYKLQQLPFQDLVSQSVIRFSGQTYVSFLSKSFGLSIYKFMGLNGLQAINKNPMKVHHGLQVYSFDVRPWHFSATRPLLLILTRTTIEVIHSNVYGDSLNLSSKNLCNIN